MGSVRSVRLPRALDAWYDERLQRRRDLSSSELLVDLIDGGLRLREGYMAIHRVILESYALADDSDGYGSYRRCLLDTFGASYVAHLESWLVADRVIAAAGTLASAVPVGASSSGRSGSSQ